MTKGGVIISIDNNGVLEQKWALPQIFNGSTWVPVSPRIYTTQWEYTGAIQAPYDYFITSDDQIFYQSGSDTDYFLVKEIN